MIVLLGIGWRVISLIFMRPKANFGKTFSEEAEKVIGYLVAKNILGFLCALENDTFDNLFLPVLITTLALLPRMLGISHLNKTFRCSAEGLIAYQMFVDALL